MAISKHCNYEWFHSLNGFLAFQKLFLQLTQNDKNLEMKIKSNINPHNFSFLFNLFITQNTNGQMSYHRPKHSHKDQLLCDFSLLCCAGSHTRVKFEIYASLQLKEIIYNQKH